MTKPAITRTYGQIHFEDLDPKRFEDLVRQLIYDFKDWQSLEATGRGGSDDGFDIRAFEKVYRDYGEPEENPEEPLSHPMNGNQWMVQCKREQELGPIQIRKIIRENIDPANPPYGYILAVAANVSKRTYDAFRDELQRLQIMEFFLWGKAALEDMLYLPKNDRILFTFFGVSLTSRRRSRATEVRAAVAAKNKLAGLLGTGQAIHQEILLRDLKDEEYPFVESYPDFEGYPRWKSYTAIEQHPLGLLFQVHEYYACIDTHKREYDYIPLYDLAKPVDHESYQSDHQKQQAVISNWELMPKSRQAYFNLYGLVNYKDMTVIDLKGDSQNGQPHIFVDFLKGSPFDRFGKVIKFGQEEIEVSDFKRVRLFPEKIERQKPATVHQDRVIVLNQAVFQNFQQTRELVLFATDNRYDYLQQRDVVEVRGENETETGKVMITHISQMTVKQYLEQHLPADESATAIRLQLGKAPGKNALLRIYEVKTVYSYELEEKPE